MRGAGHADLLAEHGPDGDLVAVDLPGHPQPGVPRDQRAEHRVVGEARRRRRPGRSRRRAGGGCAPRPRRGRAGRAARTCAATNAVPARLGLAASSSRTVPGPCGRSQRAGVPARPGGLDARHQVVGEEVQQRVARERRAHRQPHRRPCRWRDRVARPRRPRSSVGVRGVDLAHGVVELPDAGEAGRERDVGVGQVRGLDQHPRGLRAPGPGQGERAGAELRGEEPGQVARGVADPPGQSLDALAVDDAVGDQPHRPPGGVGRDVPVRAAGGGVGQAALAGAVAGRLGGRGAAGGR